MLQVLCIGGLGMDFAADWSRGSHDCTEENAGGSDLIEHPSLSIIESKTFNILRTYSV
jgi:hypothetical protein